MASTTTIVSYPDKTGYFTAPGLLLIRQISDGAKIRETNPPSDAKASGVSNARGGLSAKAKIIIGVIVPVVALFIIGVAVFLCIAKRRRKARGTAPAPPPQPEMAKGPHELRSNTADGKNHELDSIESAMIAELETAKAATTELIDTLHSIEEPSELRDLRAEEEALRARLAQITEAQRQLAVELP